MVNGERAISGFRTELIAKGVSIITGSGLLIILARELGSNNYGRLSLALSVFSFGVLFAKFGFPISGARYITEYLQKDTKKIRFIIRITTVYVVGSTVVVCGLLLILTPVIDQNLVGYELQSLLAVGTLYIAAQSFASYPRRIFQAFGAIELASLNSVLTGICNFVFVLAFIYLGWEEIGAVIGYTLSLTLVAGLSMVLLYSRFYLQYESTGFDSEIARKIFEYNFSLAATSGARAIEKEIDILMIGFFLSPTMVGVYAVGKRITTKLNAPASALGFTLSPMYSEKKLSSGVSEAGRLYREALTRVLLVYIPATVGLILVARPLIRYLFGAEYLLGTVALQILSMLALLQSIGNITASGLDYLGKAKRRAWLKTMAVVANILLNLLLIPTIGVAGAALATVSSYSVYILGTVAIMQTELKFVSRDFITDLMLICLSTLLMAIPVFLLRDNIRGLLGLFAVVGTGIAVWLIVVYTLGLVKKEELNTLLSLSSGN